MLLINGDFRNNIIDIIRKYDGNIIIVSDPPFNVGYKYDNYKDKIDESDYYDMMNEAFGHSPSVVIHYPESLYKISFRIGKFPERVISWVYNSNTARQHRDIAFFGIKPEMKQIRQDYKNPEDKRIKKRIEEGKKGAKLYDWWNINQVKNINKEKTCHPCQMPEQVMCNIIGLLPYECTVLDPFMGSGTTGVATMQMNKVQGCKRDFIGIEISKGYYEISKKRIEDKVKENGQLKINGL